MAVTHTYVSAITDSTDTTIVHPSDWNADHEITSVTLKSSAGATGDVIATRDSSGVLALRNGTTQAQNLRVYNTWTDASNYERGILDWATTANRLTLGMQKAGTGASRLIDFAAGNANSTLTLDLTVDYVTNFLAGSSQSIALTPASNAFVYISKGGSTTGGTEAISLNSQSGIGNISTSRYIDLSISMGGNFDETAAKNISISAQSMSSSNVNFLVGGNVNIAGGTGAVSTTSTGHGGNVYLDGGQGYGTGIHGNVITGNTRGFLLTATVLTSNLPTPVAALKGARSFVSNASAATFASTFNSGGANNVPVYCDGTNWRVG